MNSRKLQQLQDNQTGVAKKVLAAVPSEEFWPASQIVTELYKVLHCRVDLHTVQGCLQDLSTQGLVREFPKGSFRRILPKDFPPPSPPAAVAEEIAAELPPKVKVVKVVPPPSNIPIEPTDWISRLAGLANSLRRSADAIDDIALAVQDEIEEAKGSNAKLKQLQAVLTGVGA